MRLARAVGHGLRKAVRGPLIFALIAGLAAIECPSVVLGQPAARSEQRSPTPSERFAGVLARASIRILQQDQPPPHVMEAAAILMREAATTNPRDPELWRLLSSVASLVDRDDLRDLALDRVVELDPEDDVARLKWLSKSLRQHQTADDLANAIEALLEPTSRERQGTAVSSRLAFDLALLERRRGEDGRFADRLAQAVALDPSNQAAAAVAAGYFQSHVDDPVAQGELLLHLVLANPVDIEHLALLGSHLLDNGAYAGAERFYMMAIRSHAPMGLRPAHDLVADAAIARFGRGDLSGALRLLNEHQREHDILLQQMLQRDRPELSPLERIPYTALLTPTFATVRLAVQHRLGHDAATSLDLALQTYDDVIREIREENSPDRERHIALMRLEKAWVILWFGGSLEQARDTLDAARGAAELSETAEARFGGWEALRQGDLERALSLLEPVAEEDPPARLGLALALLERGSRRNAARELLALARSQPGTLLGAYAGDRLADVLGQRAPLSAQTAALNELAETAPRTLDRMAAEPTTALSIRLSPSATTFGPYDPLLINIEITNHSALPLAINPAGPIRPEVAIVASMQITDAESGALRPIIVGIDRRLRLMPRERLVVPIDLRHTIVGDLLDRNPLAGAMLRVRGVLNFRAIGDEVVVPGLLGSESSPPSMRVDGARVTTDWLTELSRRLQSPEQPALPELALLAYSVGGPVREGSPTALRRLIEDSRTTVATAFGDLDATSQAWLLSVLPPAPEMDQAIEPFKRRSDRNVQLAQLLSRVRGGDDPLLNELRRGTDPNLRRMAEVLQKMLADPDGPPLLAEPALVPEPGR